MAHLGLVVPGGSLFLSAVLRVPAVALAERGVEVRDVGLASGYNFSNRLEDNREYFEGVRQQVQAAIDEREWSEITLVGKSIGTMILGAIGGALSLPPVVNAIWLTPTFALDYVREGAIATGWRSLIVSGSGDHWYDVDSTSAVVAALGADELVIEGADHNLEIARDVKATLRALDDLADATLRFSA